MITKLPPCPLLPPVDRPWHAADLARFSQKGRATVSPEECFLTALRCAQSRWQDGLPAQALLMLNRAFSIVLPDDSPVFERHPMPYPALAWMLAQPTNGHFLGNPRVHFQHLATRMNTGPARNLRVARAWACWLITRHIRPEFPADTKQIAAGEAREPTRQEVAAMPAWSDRPAEHALWENILSGPPVYQA